jgi:hypothetical protein
MQEIAMRLNSNPGVATGMFAFMDGLGRAFFKPAGPAPARRDPGPFYWKVMYIDEDGVLCRSTVRVIALNPDMRRLTVWSDALGRECTLKISKIVEASDLQSGRKVNLHRWMATQGSRPD